SMYGLDRLLPDLCKFLASSVENIQESEIDIAKFQESYGHLRRETIHHLSAFICSPTLDKNMAKNGTDTYYHTLHTICILDSLLLHRPCCRLVSMAWLIPAIPAGVPAISLVAYAAEELADFANDPAGPLTFDCTRIGNSWLHRLGIFLLHQCQ